MIHSQWGKVNGVIMRQVDCMLSLHCCLCTSLFSSVSSSTDGLLTKPELITSDCYLSLSITPDASRPPATLQWNRSDHTHHDTNKQAPAERAWLPYGEPHRYRIHSLILWFHLLIPMECRERRGLSQVAHTVGQWRISELTYSIETNTHTLLKCFAR